MTDEYLDNLPFLSRGMAAALRELVNRFLETDAANALGQDALNEIANLVLNKEPFDPAAVGLLSATDLFVGRTVYWAMQAREALPERGLPEVVLVQAPPAKTATGKRSRRIVPPQPQWVDVDGSPVDALERKDE